MTESLAALYAQHLESVRRQADRALELGGFDHLVIASGQPPARFMDDQDYAYIPSPPFLHWLPLTDAPGSWLVHTPGQRTRLVFLQPRDYWHAVPSIPEGYWVEHFDIEPVRTADEAVARLPTSNAAVIATPCPPIERLDVNNPQKVIDALHWYRSRKTPYELALMRQANRIGARAHRAAAQAFRAGESELGIHLAYLQAAGQIDAELPYPSIVALNRHAAVLHYMRFDRCAPAQHDSFLIDAGASTAGYASDITRTHAAGDATAFQALIDSVDAAQQGFAAKVRAGQSYPELHLHAHHVLAGVLREHGLIHASAEAAVENGISRAFFPHGLGHPIGLQVHDVAGFQSDEHGTPLSRLDGHPFLRTTRTLQPGMVVTIEPGLYFIDMLLEELRALPAGHDVDWTVVDALRRYGGIRIEDDVVCTEDAPENLTRDAFAAFAD